jgi:hypothetical protein
MVSKMRYESALPWRPQISYIVIVCLWSNTEKFHIIRYGFNLQEFIFSFVYHPQCRQQYQDLKLNNFKVCHCTSCFDLLGHHQVCWNSGQLLCLPRYCDQCSHIYNVFKWSHCSSSSFTTCIVFLVCLLSIKCAVWLLSTL